MIVFFKSHFLIHIVKQFQYFIKTIFQKSPHIIEYSPKKSSNKIKTHGTVDVWRNISVQELAKAMDRDLGKTKKYIKICLISLFLKIH